MGKMINFRHINAEGDFTKLHNHHGLEFTQKGDQIRLLCPFHEDTNPSLSITLVDTEQAKANTFHCFGCGAKGSLIDFHARLTNNSDLRQCAEEVANIVGCSLAPPRGGSTSQSRKTRPSAPRRDETKADARKAASSPQPDAQSVSATNSALNFELKLDLGHDAVLRRLDEEAAEFFGVGMANRGSMEGRICIPIHSAGGDLVAYVGRWADEDVPDDEDKYRFPSKFNKMVELFNLHRLKPKDQHIVLVEGFFSAMRLHQLGVPVVALMGTAISDEQVTLLKRHGTKSVLVLLDGDDPGRKASEGVTLALARHLFTRTVHLPDGSAPDDLDEDTLGAFLPFWRLKNQF